MNSMGLNKTWVNPIKYASVTATASGDNAVVAAVTNRKIRLLSAIAVATTAETVQWQDATGNLSGAMPLAANGGFAYSADPSVGILQTHDGERLDLNNTGGADVLGQVSYIEV